MEESSSDPVIVSADIRFYKNFSFTKEHKLLISSCVHRAPCLNV